MTFRVKPVDRGRAERDPSRRTFYMNIGFGLAVVIAVLILLAVAGTTWYGDHLAAAANVDGQTITMDQFRDRANVEQFRINQQASRIQGEVSAGRLTSSAASTQISDLNNQLDPTTFTSTVIEKLIDGQLQSKLAAALGVTVTPADVDQRILQDKTRPEERHAWVIEVTPAVDSGQTAPNDLQRIDAKQKIDDALAQLQAGKSFEDVAKAVSDDPSKTSGGDLGFIDQTAADDAAWLSAMFQLPVNGTTGAIEGADGSFRIGKVTEIVPAQVDQAWDQKLANANISQDSYRAAIQSEALRGDLEAKIIADDSQPSTQKRVSELYIPDAAADLGAKAVKVRHILYSPKDDPQNASKVPATDPSWAQAQQQAEATYQALLKDPTQFDAIARKDSDEASDKGPDGTGGKLPYFDENSVSQGLDADFAKAILADGLQPGQILPPVKSAFGWHVIQVMYRPPNSDEMDKLKQQADGGANWNQLVADFSEGPHAGSGGDIGWVTKGQIDDRLTNAILSTPVNGVTPVVYVPGDGLYLYKVLEEKTATPDADQLAAIKGNAFAYWYNAQKANAQISRPIVPDASATP